MRSNDMIIFYYFLGVVMIRCDIHKGKLRLGNFIEPGRDAQPRKDEGFVLDHGNIGKLRNYLNKFGAFTGVDIIMNPEGSQFGP